MNRRTTMVAASGLLASVLGWTQPAGAAGFAIIEHSAQGMGNAFAGGGAVAEDASTVWFNPASIARLDSQMQVSGHLIRPGFEFSDRGSTDAFGRPLLSGIGGTVGARTVSDGGTDAVVPNFYYVRRLNERLSLGLAVNVPFGLATEYDDDWIGRYEAIDSEIVDVNLNPALAWRVNERLSVGAGVSVNYIDAKLTRAIDFTGACLGAAGAAAGVCTGAAAGPGQGGNDGHARVTGDDISFGFNLGVMFEIAEHTRLALAYRSEIKHKLDGKAKFTVPTVINAVGPVDAGIRGRFADDGVEAAVTLPDSFSISAYHRVHPKFGLMADATWTGWSDVPELRIVYDNPTTAGGPTVEALGWHDAWRLSLGINYYHDDRLTLRTGVAYDESPIPSAQLRTPRLPGNDRTWLAVGASYRFSDTLSADVGYAHLFVNDTPLARTSALGTFTGRYESDTDLFSAQLNYRFD